MSADTLTITSRAFYERTKSKLVASIAVSAAGLMLLGFCSSAGGMAASNNEILQTTDDQTNEHYIKSLKSLAGGYGFASFMYILAFILLVAAGIYISPVFCGSNNEKKVIRSPQEIDGGNYSNFQEKEPNNV